MIAERVRGMTSAIDLLALDRRGDVLLVLIGSEEEGAGLLTRGLAHRAWLTPRLRDWAQLAPQLELSPEAAVRALLVAPDFDGETRLAASSLRSGVVELATWRYVESEQHRAVLLERVQEDRDAPLPDAAQAHGERPAPQFRSGLSETDLGISAEELRELE